MITEERIDSVLKAKVSILTKRIVEAMAEPPQAIYLVGGYGRGEGAWYEDEKGLHPYNDFDLAVVTDKPLTHKRTEALRIELAHEVGIKWVDIDYYSLSTLKSLKPTIHNVDLLEGGKLVYGEDVIKLNELTLDEKKIGAQDLIILYWTRMWTFLGSWEGEFHQLSDDDARFFKNQMAKAVLASCDMHLIKLKKYITSYRERARIVINEYKDNHEIQELVKWAISEKLRPSDSEISKEEMTSLYFRCKALFVQSFKFAMGRKSEYFLNPDNTKYYYIFHTRYYLSFLRYRILHFKKGHSEKYQGARYAMNYVFLANNNGYLDSRMLAIASHLLLNNGYIEKTELSWDKLRIITATARNDI